MTQKGQIWKQITGSFVSFSLKKAKIGKQFLDVWRRRRWVDLIVRLRDFMLLEGLRCKGKEAI
jgi:hypothetical protein